MNDWNIAEILLEMRRRSRSAYKSKHYFLTLDGTFSRNSLYKCDKVAALFNQKLRLFALLNPKSKRQLFLVNTWRVKAACKQKLLFWRYLNFIQFLFKA